MAAAIAKRKWIHQLRGVGRRASDELPDDLTTADHESAVTSASVLATLLGELRPVQARSITLVKLQGYTVEEASREIGLSVCAVKMNIYRGIARVTAILEKTDDIDRRADPRPVRRSCAGEAALLVAIAVAEAVLLLGAGAMRPDMGG